MKNHFRKINPTAKCRFVRTVAIIVVSALAFCLVGAGLLQFCPAPIEGNWRISRRVCLCDIHHFRRFENGKVLELCDDNEPCRWIGTYDRIKCGTYSVVLFDASTNTVLVRSSLLGVYPRNSLGLGTRDLSPRCATVLERPQKQWLTDDSCFDILIRGHGPNAKLFFNGVEIAEAKLYDMMKWITFMRENLMPTVNIYTEKSYPMPSFLQIVKDFGFEYRLQTNQNWIAEIRGHNLVVVKNADGEFEYYLDGRRVDVLNNPNCLCEGEVGTVKRDSILSAKLNVFARDKCLPVELEVLLNKLNVEYRVWFSPEWMSVLDRNKIGVAIDGSAAKKVYTIGGRKCSFEEVKNELLNYMLLKEFVQQPFIVYAKDSILPENIEKCFITFGLTCEVRSDSTLKRKGG